MKTELFQEVNILENPQITEALLKVMVGVFALSLPSSLAIAYVFLDLATVFNSPGQFWLDIGLSVIMYLILVLVHELIHGLFFKVFKPSVQVKFGFKAGMAYATSPGSRYSAMQFSVILLMPFILITLGLLLASLMKGLSPLVFIILVVLHTPACAGDFYFLYLITKAPATALVEDTDQGIRIFRRR